MLLKLDECLASKAPTKFVKKYLDLGQQIKYSS
jgi:hypothetical protein